MASLLVPIVVALLAVAIFFLGLTDRPPFEVVSGKEFYAIVAVSDKKDIGGNVMRLLQGTIKGIQATPNGKALLEQAAASYGSPEGADAVSFGLYFDDPAQTDHPRWALGFAVDASSLQQAKDIAAHVGAVDEEPVRAVRVSLKSALKAKIPWRTSLTPMIAPSLHWKRAFAAYKAGGHTSSCGRHSTSVTDCAYALEVYVTGPKRSRAWIDYVVVMGDNTNTFDDLYPEEKKEEAPAAVEGASEDRARKEESVVNANLPQDVETPPETAAAQVESPPAQVETPPPQEETPPPQEETPPPQEETPPPQEETPPPQEESAQVQEETPPPQEETPPPVEETAEADNAPLEEEAPPVQEEATNEVESEEAAEETEEEPSDAEETATE